MSVKWQALIRLNISTAPSSFHLSTTSRSVLEVDPPLTIPALEVESGISVIPPQPPDILPSYNDDTIDYMDIPDLPVQVTSTPPQDQDNLASSSALIPDISLPLTRIGIIRRRPDIQT